MTRWADILALHLEAGKHSVLLTVGEIKGSTPRETGARMLITAQNTCGTIGGGQLEYKAIQKARDILKSKSKAPEIMSLPLGPELAQCCGGSVDLLLAPLDVKDRSWLESVATASSSTVLMREWKNGHLTYQLLDHPDELAANDTPLKALVRSVQTDSTARLFRGAKNADDFILVEPVLREQFHLVLFGAGHVGKALVGTLTSYPCRITWVDGRAEEFPAECPPAVKQEISAQPASFAKSVPAGSFCLVMTHSHQLDLDICEALLKKGDAAFVGLIGSQTKRKKFERRLASRGLSENDIANLTCPIGLPGLYGKHPAEIAISVSAQLLQIRQEQLAIGQKGEKKIRNRF